MNIHCVANIPVAHDEPAHCIRQFVRLLRDCALATEQAELNIRLVGKSSKDRAHDDWSGAMALSSEADVLAAGIPEPPLRDGMFAMKFGRIRPPL